jgi:hypothetical protein
MLLLVINNEISKTAASTSNVDDTCDSNHASRPRSSMVERVTSNDEVAGSIPSEGIQATSNNFFCIFLVRSS